MCVCVYTYISGHVGTLPPVKSFGISTLLTIYLRVTHYNDVEDLSVLGASLKM